MNISIIIPTILRRLEYMEDLMASLHAQMLPDVSDVMVVCSGVSPDSVLEDIVKRWDRRLPIRLVQSPRKGLHHARHCGAEYAAGEWLIYLDDDVRLAPGWLIAYKNFFVSNLGRCAGGRVIPEWEIEPLPWLKNISPDIFSLLDYGYEIRELAPREGINGCNFAIRKDILFKYGGFHPDGFGSEHMKWRRADGEYGLVQNLKAGGEKIYYLPEALLQHRIPEERMTPNAVQRACQLRAVSSAYHFFRARSYLQLTAVGMILFAVIFASMNGLLMLMSPGGSGKMKLKMESTRMSTFAHYGFKVLSDNEFRKYIKKQNYLEE